MNMQLKAGMVVGIPIRGREKNSASGLIQPEVAITWATMMWPMNMNVAWAPVRNVKRDICRNGIARDTVEMGCPYLWFLDDDVQPPPDAALRLVETMKQAPDDVMVVGGVYTSKSDVAEPLVFINGNGVGAHWKWKRGDIFECDSIATGCMLIKTEVFKHIESPWFRDVDNDTEGWTIPHKADGAMLKMTDDIWFCEKVRGAGFKILCDSRVICSHWDVENDKPYELAPNSYPMTPPKIEVAA